jgi:hypothetical protein
MRPAHDPLTRWLAAERDDVPDEAEEALLELMAALPPLAPPAGFADRVLACVAVAATAATTATPATARAAAPAGRFAKGWLRWSIALCLLATGLSLAWLPQTLAALADLWSPAGFLQTAIRLGLDAIRWTLSAAEVGQTVLAVGEAIALSLARPQVMAIALICLAVSVTSFRLLRGLVSREKGWSHVDSL